MRALLLLPLLAACSSATDDLKALAADPAACDTDADCCVVTDGCLSTSYVVGKADFARAKDLAAEAEKSDTCAGCIAPLVEVACAGATKKCAGVEVDPESPRSAELAADHCGAVLQERPPETGSSVLGCGAE